ncbi:uncharacterized protein LOC112569580 isoform X2 [Pomacea canaliculata]|uniref:uncharacterized protein LOC112569580 isoform X2 n=1 Tax=Pomacea canaliculata TaxID=400727 RepID=UPI000D739CD6|nr:uncharacterized protein LOC112569580 isoform X2 [Pomacea canaliculata]
MRQPRNPFSFEKMATTRAMLGLYLLFVTPIASLDLLHSRRLRRDTPSVYSKSELADKLKDVLERDRPDSQEKPRSSWGLDDDHGGFRALFDNLDDIAEHLPEELTDFDFGSFLGDDQKESFQKVLQSQCFRNSSRLSLFLRQVHDVMKELHEELLDKSHDNDDTSHAGNDNSKDSDDDDHPTTTDDDDDRTSRSPPVTEDTDESHSDESPMTASLVASNDNSKDDVDIDDIFEMLSAESLECVSGFLNDEDEKELCQQFSKQSSHVFSKFAAVVECTKHMDRDDDLDDGVQRALLTRLLAKPLSTWTSQDLQHALSVSPDAIDDDFLEDLSDDLFEENLSALSRLATRRGANPSLQVALRQRILAGQPMDHLDAKQISGLGKGLLALSDDSLDDLDPQELLNADLYDIFDDDDDDDDDSSEHDSRIDDDDDDDDDDDLFVGRRLAIGHRMMQAPINGSQQLAKVVRFLYDDLDFIENVDADDLLEAAADLKGLDLDDDDAAILLRRMSQSPKFPSLTQVTVPEMVRLKAVLPGLTPTQLQQLPRQVVKDALDTLKDLDFGESQARELLDDVFDDDDDDDDSDDDDDTDDKKARHLSVEDFRRIGALARGLDADDIEDLDDDVVSKVIDDIDDLDLSDAQKRLFVEKARQAMLKNPGAVSLIQLPGLANAVSIDDIDDLDDNEVVKSLQVSSKTNWRAAQAATLVEKVKKSLGGRSLRPSDVTRLGTLSRGLLPRDLDDMVDRPDDVDDLADVLGDHEDELSSGIVDNIVDKIRDKDDLDDLGDIKVTASYVAQKGVFLAYLSPNEFSSLEFDDDAKKAFVALMSKMNTAKLPRDQLEFLADEISDMIDDKQEDDQDKASSRRLRLLGGMALGLTPEHIKEFSGRAIMDNLGPLGVLPFTRLQARAILDKLDDVDPEWKCKTSIVASAGPLLQFADDDKLETICEKALAASFSSIERRLERHHELVEERWEEGLWREDTPDTRDTPDDTDLSDVMDDVIDDVTEDSEGKKRLVTRMLAAATVTSLSSNKASGRRRRATTGDLSCSVLRQLRQDVVLVGVDRVAGMSDQEFKDCLEFVGNASNWADKDLAVLLARAKQVLGNYSTWTNELVRRAGVLVAAMAAEDIAKLKLTGVDSLNSIGKHGRLNEQQLLAGFTRWLELKKKNNITAVTAGEFSSLSEFVCGLSVVQISELPVYVFKQSLDVLGKARSCNAQQLGAYVSRAHDVFGKRVVTWSPAVVGDMGHLLGGLSSSSVQELAGHQLALIQPGVISRLPVDTVKALTVAQLKQLSTNQVNSLRLAHYNALSKDQQAVLDTKATVSFQKSSKVPSSSVTSDTGIVSSSSEKPQTSSQQPGENARDTVTPGRQQSSGVLQTSSPALSREEVSSSQTLASGHSSNTNVETFTTTTRTVGQNSESDTKNERATPASEKQTSTIPKAPQTTTPSKVNANPSKDVAVNPGGDLTTSTTVTSEPKTAAGNPVTAVKPENTKQTEAGENEASKVAGWN